MEWKRVTFHFHQHCAFVCIAARGLTVIIANVFAAIYGTICVLWSVLMNYTGEIDVECQ